MPYGSSHLDDSTVVLLLCQSAFRVGVERCLICATPSNFRVSYWTGVGKDSPLQLDRSTAGALLHACAWPDAEGRTALGATMLDSAYPTDGLRRLREKEEISTGIPGPAPRNRIP